MYLLSFLPHLEPPSFFCTPKATFFAHPRPLGGQALADAAGAEDLDSWTALPCVFRPSAQTPSAMHVSVVMSLPAVVCVTNILESRKAVQAARAAGVGSTFTALSPAAVAGACCCLPASLDQACLARIIAAS